MTKEAKIILGVALLCIGLVLWRYNVQTSNQSVDEATVVEESTPGSTETLPADKDEVEAKTKVAVPPSRPNIPPQDKVVIASKEKSFSFKVPTNIPQEEQELVALDRLTQGLYLFSSNEQSPELLVQRLTAAGLKPLVVQDFNEDTGKMIIIRTDETLPGTRYFHAQYFEDENKKPFLQHMSFEFRPGDKTLDEAVTAVQKAFPKMIGEPQRCTKGYVGWEYGDMTLHCKDIDPNQEDATRARSEEDNGAVKCSIEINPHPHEELCG